MSVIEDQASAGHCNNHAWVVMPDHVHWLLSILEFRPLAQVVAGCKAISTRRFRTAGLITTSPWQSGYYEHRLRDDEDLLAQARYLIANPLRAKLVSSLADYPWWFAQWASSPHGPIEQTSTGENLLW